MNKKTDLIGKKLGKWDIIAYVGKVKNKDVWLLKYIPKKGKIKVMYDTLIINPIVYKWVF